MMVTEMGRHEQMAWGGESGSLSHSLSSSWSHSLSHSYSAIPQGDSVGMH